MIIFCKISLGTLTLDALRFITSTCFIKTCFYMRAVSFINIKYVIVSISGLLNNMLR